MPSHQALLTTLESIEVMRTKPPSRISSSPMTLARDQKAPKGCTKAQIAPPRNKMPSRTCAHCQRCRTAAIRNSFAIAARKITPIKTPMVATDVVLIRSTITEMISHAIPVSSGAHHGPASCH
jgi:hypothetical protein